VLQQHRPAAFGRSSKSITGRMRKTGGRQIAQCSKVIMSLLRQ
jgi:hypothetical protein